MTSGCSGGTARARRQCRFATHVVTALVVAAALAVVAGDSSCGRISNTASDELCEMLATTQRCVTDPEIPVICAAHCCGTTAGTVVNDQATANPTGCADNLAPDSFCSSVVSLCEDADIAQACATACCTVVGTLVVLTLAPAAPQLTVADHGGCDPNLADVDTGFCQAFGAACPTDFEIQILCPYTCCHGVAAGPNSAPSSVPSAAPSQSAAPSHGPSFSAACPTQIDLMFLLGKRANPSQLVR